MVNLLTLLDDIASTLDDVAAMSKVAMHKTSAIMSDDLAVNAGVITGVHPDRELPLVKSIFVGSLWNKAYCIAGVLLLMTVYPPLIQIILVIGGLYLCYEGAHKIQEKILHKSNKSNSLTKPVSEQDRVKGAIRTDLILSIEIIVIAKGTLSGSYMSQVLALIAVGLGASILIYGLVAIIVKLDDIGLLLIEKGYKSVGGAMVNTMPFAMKGLGILGTLAMLMVGGGILSHTLHLPHLLNEPLQNVFVGLISGGLLLLPFGIFKAIKKVKRDESQGNG